MANVQTIDAPAPRRGDEVALDELPAPTGSEHRAPRQLAITIVAEVAPAQVARLTDTLHTMGKDPGDNGVLPFGALPRAHFARLLLLDATRDLSGQRIDPQLLYIADVDEPPHSDAALEHCLGELVDVAGDGLDDVFGCCVGYPAGRAASRQERLAFLRAHLVEPAAAYVNTPGRSLGQIRREAELRDAIQAFLDDSGVNWSGRAPGEVRAAIQGFVDSQEHLAFARTPPPSPELWDRLVDTARMLRLPLGLLVLSPVLLPALPVWAVLLRLREVRDEPETGRPSPEHAAELAMAEDLAAHNQFSAVGFVKPGLLRQLTTGVVTRGIDYASRHIYRRGSLAGVKTIHFARWVFLDDRRRMIFASNYDGTLEGYNGDFIHLVAWGLNAVFSNGVGYPRTRWLFFGGANQEQDFKDYLRRQQVPTQVWHSAYPQLTARNITNNAHIRAGLYGDLNGEETRRWLCRLGL